MKVGAVGWGVDDTREKEEKKRNERRERNRSHVLHGRHVST